jgi:hypothetical protein
MIRNIHRNLAQKEEHSSIPANGVGTSTGQHRRGLPSSSSLSNSAKKSIGCLSADGDPFRVTKKFTWE